jgi:nucleoside-diphosphate-sugar epimerase
VIFLPSVLIIGGKGFLGRTILENLKKNGFKCLIGTRRIDTSVQDKQIIINPFNAINLEGNKVEIVIIASGYYTKNNSFSESEKLLSTHVGILDSVLKTNQLSGALIITFGSYFEKSPDDSDLKLLDYTKIKLAAKKELFKSLNKFQRAIIYIYLYDTYGNNDKRGKVLDYIISTVKSGGEPKILNPKSLINLTNALNIAEGIRILINETLDKKTFELFEFQIRSNNDFSLFDLVNLVQDIYKNKCVSNIKFSKLNQLWDCADNIPNWLFEDNIEKFILESIQ